MNLTENDLYKTHDNFKKLKEETYERLYINCTNGILMTAKNGDFIYIFKIPSFLMGNGYPLINIPSCATYIMNKLTLNFKKMKVMFVNPNIILIDWRRN